jgi:hypothetical protein
MYSPAKLALVRGRIKAACRRWGIEISEEHSMQSEVVREAKLFEAGQYPDRGIEFTEADLDAVVAGFKPGGVPVRVEHGMSPWDGKMGRVVAVWRAGRDLMARISWPRAVWDFLCAMGTKSLSVGFDYRSRRLVEVSVVDKPRVLTARAFGDSVLVFSAAISCETGGKRKMAEDLDLVVSMAEERGRTEGRAAAETQFAEREKGLTRTIASLQREDSRGEAAVKLSMWKREGKLPPACEKFAEAILVDGSAEVTFADGGHMPVAEAFVQFITHLPRIVEMSGEGIENKDGKTELSDHDKQVYKLLGVSEEEVAAANAE